MLTDKYADQLTLARLPTAEAKRREPLGSLLMRAKAAFRQAVAA
ncbi:MAG: hypothetical protein U0836_17425 [Pirellulales bacterium]